MKKRKRGWQLLKNKNIFTIAIISFVIFIGIATYLWYLYFHDYETKLREENCTPEFYREVALVNTGNINYIDAKTEDSDVLVPVYYFSVKNSANRDYDYVIVFEDSDGNDGCTKADRLQRDELEYELTFDNKIVKTAGLDTLSNNILDTNVIKAKGTNDYSLKIRLKNNVTDYQKKHFHYVVNIREKE